MIKEKKSPQFALKRKYKKYLKKNIYDQYKKNFLDITFYPN